VRQAVVIRRGEVEDASLAAYVVPREDGMAALEQPANCEAERISLWQTVFQRDLQSGTDPRRGQPLISLVGIAATPVFRSLPKKCAAGWMRPSSRFACCSLNGCSRSAAEQDFSCYASRHNAFNTSERTFQRPAWIMFRAMSRLLDSAESLCIAGWQMISKASGKFIRYRRPQLHRSVLSEH
jgi:hypothetical protein